MVVRWSSVTAVEFPATCAAGTGEEDDLAGCCRELGGGYWRLSRRGIVLAILSVRPACGYEITAWLRDQGFSDIAEGTVYALLVRVDKHDIGSMPARVLA